MVLSRQMTSKEIAIIQKLEEFVRKAHAHSDSHDYAHVLTVCRNAILISKKIENPVDPFICICGALLHDIGKTSDTFAHMHGLIGGSIAEEFLDGLKIERDIRDAICRVVIRHTPTSMIPPETAVEKVVYDADCLDRLGLMGLLRGFIGKKGSMDEIMQTYMDRRKSDYEKLHFDASRELGEWKEEELEGLIKVTEKRLQSRLASIEDLFLKEGIVSDKFDKE